MSLPDRTPAQRAQDDEDHRLAMCGLTFDARSDEELEDFQTRHYDFIFGPTAGSANTLPAGPNGGGPGACQGTNTHRPAASFFAPGSSRARYPLGAKQGPRAWEETPARTGAVSLVPPPLSNT